jgi:uncharacterized membrane protein
MLASRSQPLSRISNLAVLWLVSAVATAQQGIAPAQLKCTGNEPFWSVDVGPDNALLDRLAQPREQAVYRGELRRFTYLDPEWLVWRGQSIQQSTRVLTIVARREACHDTMADGPPADYRTVILFADGTAATGCCRARFAYDANEAPPADHAKKTPEDWSRLLPGLAPGIGACINDGGVPVASVAHAAPLEDGRASALLRSTDGSLQTCTVDLATRKIESIEPLAGTAPAGTDRPRLLPAREQPPLVTCGRLERALDERGQLIGYLHYEPCN